jgi:ankyrin repeat protein
MEERKRKSEEGSSTDRPRKRRGGLRTVDPSGKEHFFKNLDGFFKLPVEIQVMMLSNYGMNPDDIDAICLVARGDKTNTKMAAFVANVCDNYTFWKSKYTTDFGETFSADDLNERSTSAEYWKHIYIESFFYAQKNLAKLLHHLAKEKKLSRDELLDRVKKLISSGITVDTPSRLLVRPGHGGRVVVTTPLITLSAIGHAEGVNALLRAGADVDKQDAIGATALMTASGSGRLEIVRTLLRAGADVDKQDAVGATALMPASRAGQLETVRALLHAGADVDKQDANGSTALMFASGSGQLETVRALLHAGADTDKQYANGLTALMSASRNGHLEIVRTLLRAGADVDKQDANGWTALMIASGNGHLEIVRTLLRAGADVDKQVANGWTALMIASRDGHLETVRALLRARADPGIANKIGKTALMYALEGHGPDTSAIEALLRSAMARRVIFTVSSRVFNQTSEYTRSRNTRNTDLETLKGWLE